MDMDTPTNFNIMAAGFRLYILEDKIHVILLKALYVGMFQKVQGQVISSL